MTRFTREALQHFARTHGVASRADLHRCGLTRHQVESLRRAGSLVPVLRGVYRMPAVPWTELGRCVAVCRVHPSAVIAGPTAGRIWGFRQLPGDHRVHVLVPPHAQPTIARWVVPHRTSARHDDERTVRGDGIVVASRLRTAADLARWPISDRALGSILEQALHDGGHQPDELRRLAFAWRSPNRPWTKRVLGLLGDRVPGGAAESHAEFVVGEALVDAGVTGITRQFSLVVPAFGRVRFDLAVPRLRWAIEVDVFPTHAETAGIRADRQRDAAVAGVGWETTRVGPDDLGAALPATVDRLRSELDRRAGRSMFSTT